MPCLARTFLALVCLLRPPFNWAEPAQGRAVKSEGIRPSHGQEDAPSSKPVCGRFATGSQVESPAELRSSSGVLKVNLNFRGFRAARGEMRYCYVSDEGIESPTLRLRPGDLLIINLRNELESSAAGADGEKSAVAPEKHNHPAEAHAKPGVESPAACTTSAMSPFVTNLHFHGLAVPPTCHGDEVLRTLVPPDTEFQYRIRIPRDQPPGLYWYHPHAHGLTEAQVMGGASGALIVEGIEAENPMLAGLPERVLVIRDQQNADGRPGRAAGVADGAYVPEKPSNDLSINSVPVPYPDYPLAVIPTQPGRRELWRVLNASADTYLDLQLKLGKTLQPIGIVAFDGASIWHQNQQQEIRWRTDVPLPPGARAEFLFDAPAAGADVKFVTWGVQTGPLTDDDFLPGPNAAAPDDDDHMPPRPLARIVSSSDAPPLERLPDSHPAGKHQRLVPLGEVSPDAVRKLFFSEQPLDAKNPAGAKVFLITEEGQVPKAFDPSAATPNITVRQGEVEDWIIENRSQESHVFHIHQTHFVVLQRDGAAVDEPYLRDTVEVPYWDGYSDQFPSVKVRIDFRGAGIVGTFPYHCHVLLHEDGGMMGTIRVLPAGHGKRD
jgi:FtsP/CotA-like multicopper oxidase with cupredoxin domain